MDNTTIGGKWKISGENYDGDLTLNKEKGIIILSIYYKNNDEPFAWMDKPDEFNIISGELNQKIKCTLLDCIIVRKNSTLGVKHHIIITAKSIVFGLNNKKGIKFNEMHFKISNIIKWSRLSGFITSVNEYPKCRLDLKYSFKDKVSLKIDHNTIIDFEPIFGAFDYDTQIEDLKISQYIEVRIKKNYEDNIEFFFTELKKVLSLITLATGQKINITDIHGVDYRKFNLVNKEKDYIRYEVRSNLISNIDDSNPDKFENSTNYLFYLDELNNSDKLKNWFKNYERNENIYELYNLSINNIPKEIKFCNLMQALELIHTNEYNNVKKFYKHIDEKFKDNELIIDLIKNNPDQGSDFIILKNRLIDLFTDDFHLLKDRKILDNINKLSTIFADSRNYYTHYMASKKEKCLVGKNIEYANYFLEYLITSNILLNLGFSLEETNKKESINEGNIKSRKIIDLIIENKR